MSAARPPWLDPVAPWDAATQRTDVVEPVRHAGPTLSADALMALRAGRFVPVYGEGVGPDEAARLLGIIEGAFAADADPRAAEHALALFVHPALGARPIEHLARAIAAGEAAPWSAPLVLGGALALGADDALRGSIADALVSIGRMRPHCEVSAAAGGGSAGTWREHYERVCVASHRAAENERAVIRAMRAWYEWVQARRWSALDALRGGRGALTPLGRWVVDSGRWIAGDDDARDALTEYAERLLAPVALRLPGLARVVARELSELLAHPWATRWAHLRCAAARDHASIAIRHWLHAATESLPEPDEVPERDLERLGPEPTRAGRAAVAARGRPDDFILDWFVADREARRTVDAWAALALRVWHRLHGAAVLGRAFEAMRAPTEAGP